MWPNLQCWIWSHFLKKFLMGNLIFSAVLREHSNLVFTESHMNVSCIFDSVVMEQGTIYILSTFQMFVYLCKAWNLSSFQQPLRAVRWLGFSFFSKTKLEKVLNNRFQLFRRWLMLVVTRIFSANSCWWDVLYKIMFLKNFQWFLL